MLTKSNKVEMNNIIEHALLEDEITIEQYVTLLKVVGLLDENNQVKLCEGLLLTVETVG
jgi:hypothetical protein